MFESFDLWMWGIIAIDLAVAVFAIMALRYGAGLLFGVDSTKELAEKDNLAFGLTLAGGTISIAIILAAASSGDAKASWLDELGTVSAYVLMGGVLLKIGTVINDLVVFHRFSVRLSITQKNVAAGTVQAANFIALGLLIKGAIDWVDGPLTQALISVAIVFFLAQIVVIGVTRLRSYIYARRHDGARLQDALSNGNTALAVRSAGHLLGTALSASAAGGMVQYLIGFHINAYVSWIAWAVVLAAILSLLSIMAQRIILLGIDVIREVDEEKNIGVAAIEAAIFVGFGLIIQAVVG